MRVLKSIAISLLMIFVLLFAACNPFAGGQGGEFQQAQVVRGNLTMKVNGSGKTGVATDAKLAFGTGGKIEKLYVKKGDRVTKDTVLAKLETDNLELAVSQAKTALAQSQLSQTQSEVALSQADTGVEVANLNLDKIKDVADLKDKATEAQYRKLYAEEGLKEAGQHNDPVSTNYWKIQVLAATKEWADAQKDLGELLGKPEYSGVVNYDVLAQKYSRVVLEDVRVKQLQVVSAQQSVEQARKNLDYAKSTVELAQKSLAVAEKQLKDATIIAPIDGVIATLDVKEGDIISPPTLSATSIIYIIDPNTMELKIDVDEIDILSIKPGQETIISLDALEETTLKGKVISLAHVPTVVSGVVVYETKIAFTDQHGYDLKVGLSATVDIVVNEHQNVLLVPSRAVKTDEQNKSYVEIVVNNKAEVRQVTTGLSDGIQTEIIGGLTEGEMVVTGRIPPSSGLFGQ